MFSAKLHGGRGVLLPRLGLDDLRLQHVELLFGRRLLRLRGDHGGVGLARIGNRLVVGLARCPAVRHQRSGPAGIGAGPRLLGLRLHDGGLRGLDHGLLLGDLALRRLNRGRRLGRGGRGLGEARTPVGGIQHDQRVAGADALVVSDLDRGHVALDARAEHRDVALDIGVVGALDVAALGEPPGGSDADPDCRNQPRRGPPESAQTAESARLGPALGAREQRLPAFR